MIDAQQAQSILEREAAALEAVEVELSKALGRALAAPITADRDFPPTDRSAMDGYAVRSSDLTTPGQTLTVIGEIQAGEPAGDSRVGEGQALRIFTGAVLPPGADAVVMVERTTENRSDRSVHIDVTVDPGDHVRRTGEELVHGAPVLAAGTVIRAAEVAALASVGCSRPTIHRAPTVGVLATGDELVEPDRAPASHQVRNSNAPMLLAQLNKLGLEGEYLGIAPDRPDRLATLLAQGLDADVLLVTGGVSVGEYDLVGRALETAGMRLLFHKVAIKPGKPLLAGRRGNCLVFGLPGNPVSAFTGFTVFVAPVLRHLMGWRDWRSVRGRARLGAPLRGRAGRETYHLAELELRDGAPMARQVQAAGSGDVLALSRANGFVVTPVDVADLPTGSRVDTLSW